MSSLTSVELNFLIFRYLQESGFTHAAFTLGYEAGVTKSNIDENIVPPGALVKFVQKGLHYMEMEANLTNGEVDIDEDFSFFQPLDLISKDVKELQEMLRERKRKERDKEKEVEREHDGDRNRVKEKDRHEKQKEREREREKMERERQKMERETLEMEREREKIEREKAHANQLGDGERDMAIDQSEKENAGDEEHGRSLGRSS